MSVDPRDLPPELRAELGIDENGHPADGSDLGDATRAAADAARLRLEELERDHPPHRKDPMTEHRTVSGLCVPELVAVVRNDSDTFPDAGAYNVPAALEELERRAAETVHAGEAGYAEALLARRALEEVVGPVAREADRQAAGDTEAHAAAIADATTHPHNDRILAANGLAVIRERCMTAAANVPPLPAIEAAIRYVKASRAQAAAQGASRDVLDGLDNELAQFEAVHKFGRAIRALNERASARSRILDGNGATPPAA